MLPASGGEYRSECLRNTYLYFEQDAAWRRTNTTSWYIGDRKHSRTPLLPERHAMQAMESDGIIHTGLERL
jgi:hypothetical protein